VEVFRISHKNHSKQLSSSGAANRWNLDGQFVIYTASSRALATLEMIVHRNSVKPVPDYEVMVISIPDKKSLYEDISIGKLPENWHSFTSYYKLQQIGSDWYREQRSLILKVPSAVIPKEFNFIINVRHPAFNEKVSLIKSEHYFFDKRLFQ